MEPANCQGRNHQDRPSHAVPPHAAFLYNSSMCGAIKCVHLAKGHSWICVWLRQTLYVTGKHVCSCVWLLFKYIIVSTCREQVVQGCSLPG